MPRRKGGVAKKPGKARNLPKRKCTRNSEPDFKSIVLESDAEKEDSGTLSLTFRPEKQNFLKTIVSKTLEPSRFKDQLKYSLVTDHWEFQALKKLQDAAIDHIFNPRLEKPLVDYSAFQHKLQQPLSNFQAGLFLSDEQFWYNFHISRHTLESISNLANGLPQDIFKKDIEFPDEVLNFPIQTTILLVCWYLSQENEPEDAYKFFCLPNEDTFIGILMKGVLVLTNLVEHSGLTWPTPQEKEYTKNCIYNKYELPCIVGVIGREIFTNNESKRVMLQIVCNEKNMIKGVCVSFDCRPVISLQSAHRLLSDITTLAPDEFLIGGIEYSGFVLPTREDAIIQTPIDLEHVSHRDRAKIMEVNKKINNVIDIGRDAMKEIVLRFPMLKKLKTLNPMLFTAACVLHNFTIKYHEITPYRKAV